MILEATTRRLELNQSSRVGTKELLSGEKLTLWQGLAARLECALFNDTPEASSFISDLTNIESVNFIARKIGPNGVILFTKELLPDDINPFLTYAQWVANTSSHFVFELTEVDTTQIVSDSGRLPIYFVVTVTTDSAESYVAGFGSGEILNVGYIENPVASDYIPGRTPIVGGKLLSDLDLNGFKILDSGASGQEEGFVELTAGQLEGDVTFTTEKADATKLRFDRNYIIDPTVPIDFIAVPISAITTTGFHYNLTAPAPVGAMFFWKVSPEDTPAISPPAPRLVTYNPKALLSTRTIFASRGGCVLNSNINTGGGTDDTEAFQNLLDLALEYDFLEIMVDGVLRIDSQSTAAALTLHRHTRLRFLPGCGLFLTPECPASYLLATDLLVADYYNDHIEIVGGVFNGNGMNQINIDGGGSRTEPGYSRASKALLWFSKFDNLVLRNVVVRNSMVYSTQLQEGRNVFTENVSHYWDDGDDPLPIAMNHDGFHLLGPVDKGTFLNTTSNGDDDAFGFNTNEHMGDGDPRRSTTDPTGAITNILVNGLHLNRGGASIRFYSDTEIGLMSTPGYLDNINIVNVYGEKTFRNTFFCNGVGGSGRLHISNYHLRHSTNLNQTQINVDGFEYVRTDNIAPWVPRNITNYDVLEEDLGTRNNPIFFGPQLEDKLILYGSDLVSPRMGFGVAGDSFKFFLDAATSSFVFGHTNGGGGAFVELFRFKGLPGGVESWTSPTLLNSWVNFGGGFDGAGFRKDYSGQVRLRGLIKNGTVSTTPPTNLLFTLPSGYRPPNSKLFLSFSNGLPIVIGISYTGDVVVDSGTVSTTYISLENIAFSTI
jgi:hypothetical protein